VNVLPFNLRRDVRRTLEDCMGRLLQASDTIYDVGCGAKPFQHFLARVARAHVGIDMDDGFYGSGAVDIIGVADRLPVRDGVADAVLSSQVIEHLPDPDEALREARRILKPNGLLFISFPLLFPLHAAPYDFFRYTEHGFEAMCKRHGFEVVERHVMGGFWYAAAILSECYLSPLNRPVLRRLHIGTLVSLPLHGVFWLLHKAEAGTYALIGKDVANLRRGWAVNYVYVARRSGVAPPSPGAS
jgi:SAM-dependent methyltransferase